MHGVHVETPPKLNVLPKLHELQKVALAPENVPAEQEAQTEDEDAPELAENVPATQFVQTVAPLSRCFPAVQAVHTVAEDGDT